MLEALRIFLVEAFAGRLEQEEVACTRLILVVEELDTVLLRYKNLVAVVAYRN